LLTGSIKPEKLVLEICQRAGAIREDRAGARSRYRSVGSLAWNRPVGDREWIADQCQTIQVERLSE
jgi:hypothetical protein